MNTVDPIRDEEYLEDFKEYFKSNQRNYVLFMSGIYLGRRVGDLLSLKVRHVKNQDYIYFRENKTGKEAKIKINAELKRIYKNYTKGKKGYEYLFKSREGENKPITRVRAWQILNEAAKEIVYDEKIGCHSLRKTFGYWLDKNGVSAALIQDLFNHSSIDVTKRYIGINQDSKDEAISELSFKRKRR
ncbi:tyrosine-type recombinase/integrase [Clostridium disporicum]|uniref:tyrosine-type recombinase/integrase n=1 Tax=Clostridium disporicum TaxID=84024 RepID=UPI00290442AC|nr:tyrosine-type recombinase/integrase [Clostridium sp.]